ncbi:glycosyltransferase [Microbacterium sp. NPDC056234]|uniref:glycosyltransferase n=1 Tax=Microbacterium sp. NPDC056234 TaxID=3345757 RepID=UPI0035D8894D
MNKPSMLIISFSPIASDARVLKQVRGFAEEFDVTTCGFGPQPDERVEHIELGIPRPHRARRLWDEALVRFGRYRTAYWTGPTVRAARKVLRGRRFDVVISNDLDTAGLAVALYGGERVHCDLHEYWPELHGENAAWMRHRSQLYRWLLRTYVRRAASATTVSSRIAEEYRRVFDLDVAVVTNASPHQNLAAGEVSDPLRLVYSGAGDAERGLESLVEATARTSTPVELDLYLVSMTPEYRRSLEELIDREKSPTRIREPLPYRELVPTLNTYDIGIYQPKPINLNHAYALPNKVFDFVQARLALVIGPAEEMARVVHEHGIGVVTADFSTESLRRALDELAPGDVARWKDASDRASAALSAEAQQQVWVDAVHAIAEKRA